MSGKAKGRTTGIEWTEHTWNPTVGCSLATAGCTNCYAMRQAHRIEEMGKAPQYRGLTRPGPHGPVWTGRVGRSSDSAMRKPLTIREPATIFVNSMSDLFHPDMRDEWRDEAHEIMIEAGWHIYQILTKRPEEMAAYYSRRPQYAALPNVWQGVSVEDSRVLWRIAALREVPAAVRFLSVEPLIGALGSVALTGIAWIITGGESGPRARLCEPAWVREVRDQALALAIPLFHKQWGTYGSNPLVREQGLSVAEAMKLDPPDHAKGGCLLDGRQWRETPQAA